MCVFLVLFKENETIQGTCVASLKWIGQTETMLQPVDANKDGRTHMPQTEKWCEKKYNTSSVHSAKYLDLAQKQTESFSVKCIIIRMSIPHQIMFFFKDFIIDNYHGILRKIKVQLLNT